jgi:hypothetical protein
MAQAGPEVKILTVDQFGGEFIPEMLVKLVEEGKITEVAEQGA